jgi:hypothetical protein
MFTSILAEINSAVTTELALMAGPSNKEISTDQIKKKFTHF